MTLSVQSGGAEKSVDVTLGSTKDEAPTTSTAPSSSNSPFGQSPFGQQQSPFGQQQNPFGR